MSERRKVDSHNLVRAEELDLADLKYYRCEDSRGIIYDVPSSNGEGEEWARIAESFGHEMIWERYLLCIHCGCQFGYSRFKNSLEIRANEGRWEKIISCKDVIVRGIIE